MQTLDNSVRLVRKRRAAWPFTRSTTSQTEPGSVPTPATIPAGNEVTRRVAEKIGGIPRSSLNEVLLQAPVTGHIMGGCIMGKNREEGVIDFQNRVYGYTNLMVCDGSMLTENLGVNPSLTITALSERAMSFIGPKTDEIAGRALPGHYFSFEKKKRFTTILEGKTAKTKKAKKSKKTARRANRKS